MDQSSQAGSVNTPNSGDWGNMGGTPGDGIFSPESQSNMPPTPMYQTPAQQQQQPATPPLQAGSGSITRFATPAMQQQSQPSPLPSSYAERSAQSYASYSATPYSSAMTPQQQQQQQQQPASTGSYAARSAQAYPYAGQQVNAAPTPPIAPSPSVAPAGSYAARSAQAHASQPSAGSVTATPSTAGPYAARSAQSYAGQQQSQPVSTPAAASGASTGSYEARSAQAYTVQAPVTNPTAASSYAARSAQAYAGQTAPSQQTTMAPPSSSAAAAGSYAARSAQAQQQQQAPSTYVSPSQPVSHAVGAPQAPPQQGGYAAATTTTGASVPQQPGVAATASHGHGSSQAEAMQQRLLTDATRKVQEHAYYMNQAMEQKNLPVVLDRAAHMVGELGGLPHGHHHHHHSSPSAGPSNTGVSAKLNPKNYYELYMRALEDMPTFEDYLLNLATQPHSPPDSIRIVDSALRGVERAPYTMREVYDCVRYCPRVVSRLYLQISAGSALIRSGEVSAKWVMNDLAQAVRCEQNPIRGLFLRNFLLTALRDKLPDTPAPPSGAAQLETIQSEEELEMYLPTQEVDEQDKGTVKDSYEFILNNFMEMNKLWVRIQHLPGEGKNKDVRKRRERERNELRILVGTNLVRLSQLECVTSKIYGEVILPQILEHIVVCGDPLSQAYLMDCLVQVFPDEYHIETLPILLNVCPRLRDKVNIRTILQGLMDRLANYLADEELLDETDTNEVKKALARDSFGLFETCVQNVYNARGPKLTSKEVIRLQTALLQFSLKCYPGNMEQISRCIGSCVSALRQASASYEVHEGTMASVPEDRLAIKPLDEASVAELEKLLSIPLDSLALKVLELEHYSNLIGFLPWSNRREVAITMLKAVDNAGSTPRSIREIEELFSAIEPVIRDEGATVHKVMTQDAASRATSLMAGLGVSDTPPSFGTSFSDSDADKQRGAEKENALLSKVVLLLDHEDTDTLYEMLSVARNHIGEGGRHRNAQALVAVVFASVKLAQRLFKAEQGTNGQQGKTKEETGSKEEATGPSPEEEKAEITEDAKETSQSDTKESGTKGEATGPSAEDEKAETTEDAKESPQSDTKVEVGEDSSAKKEAGDLPQTTAPDTDEAAESADDAARDGERVADTKITSCRKVFVFIQETISMIATGNHETGVKLYLEMSLTADSFSAASTQKALEATDYAPIAYELLSQAYTLYEETITDSKAQQRCIGLMVGTLLSSSSLSKEDYESLITKTAQFAAKVVKKPDQCQLVALCAHLFYATDSSNSEKYSNPQRALECLQRSLKLADACTSANPSNVQLFVDLLEHYLFFFEKKNPAITHAYISGLVALIKEHINNLDSLAGDSRAVAEAKAHFLEIERYIRRKKNTEATAELFAPVQIDSSGS